MSDWSSDVCSSGLVSDPRRTPTCDIADLHLPLNPGSDVPLFNGLLTWLAAHGVVDAVFVAAHTCDLDATLGPARETAGDLDALATHCGVRRDRLAAFFELFAHLEKVVTQFSQGVTK